MKTLFLTLNKPAFDVMVTGEKTWEYRKPSQWINSRLFDKQGRFREYDVVHFRNGYRTDRPYFIAEFLYVLPYPVEITKTVVYSTGFSHQVSFGDFGIKLGDIIEKGNLITKVD